MAPSEYYSTHFRGHFSLFWRSLAEHGSVSRARRTGTGPREDQHTIEHFSVVDFLRSPRRGFPDHLQAIPLDYHLNFMSATCYRILIDQVMYTYFKDCYPAFRSLTMYPKMDRTVGPARTFMMANPFEIFAEDILRSRSIEPTSAVETFKDWCGFIVQDLPAFLERHSQLQVTWSKARAFMLEDPSCTWGAFGSHLRDALLLQQSAV